MTTSEKIRILRKANSMTQEEFANKIGVSRSNLANIELGKVKPTMVIINCVAFLFDIKPEWLTDDSFCDSDALTSASLLYQIKSKYELLNDSYKTFVSHQIDELIELQNE